jgi:IPT/TIG domain
MLLLITYFSWTNASLAASIQYTARPPMIASATVDADQRTLVVSGWHFGKRSAVVALGNHVLKVKSHSNSKLVVELPTDISPGSYRLTITVTEPSKLSSEPFSATVFAAR